MELTFAPARDACVVISCKVHERRCRGEGTEQHTNAVPPIEIVLSCLDWTADGPSDAHASFSGREARAASTDPCGHAAGGCFQVLSCPSGVLDAGARPPGGAGAPAQGAGGAACGAEEPRRRLACSVMFAPKKVLRGPPPRAPSFWWGESGLSEHVT